MPFLGTIVNFLLAVVGGLLGSLLKKGVPQRIEVGVMNCMAICVIYIGIDGMLEAPPAVSEDCFFSAGLMKVLVMILSTVVGTVVGEIINIDRHINRLGSMLEKRFTRGGGDGSFAKGFVSCSLLICVGAMAVKGALSDVMGNPDILFAKAVLDGITCFIMATSYGIGCAFSGFFVLAYQGVISLIGLGLIEILPASTITYMSVTGSLLIILIGTNVLGMTKVRTANMIPAIFAPIIVAPILQWIF